MALTTAEIARIKSELGYNLLTVGAVPYVNIYSVFDVVIQPYLQEGGDTTSSTVVTAASVATPVALTLVSATGFAAGDKVWVDVDDREESATIQSITGAAVTVLLKKAHTGTYRCMVDGGLAIVRQLLKRISDAQDKIAFVAGYGVGGLKKVEDIEFYAAGSSKSAIDLARSGADYWRDQLASVLGLTNYNKPARGFGGSIAL